MHKTVAMYGIALVIALIGAFVSWNWESDIESEDDSGVVIVPLKAEDLAKIVYEEDDLTVELVSKTDEVGDYVWATTKRTKTEEPKKPAASKPHADPHDHGPGEHGEDGADAGIDAGDADAGAAPAEEPPAEPKVTVEELAFKTGMEGNEVMERMAPFKALRKLEGATKDRFESFGLDDPRGKLTITSKSGESYAFDVGSEGYGHRNVYVRELATGDVYLVESRAVRPLRHADTRMTERSFVPFRTHEYAGIVISDGTNRIEAEHKNRDDSSARMWVPKGAEIRNVPLETWILKMMRTRGTGYATADEAKLATDKVLTAKIIPADGDPISVDLMRGQTDKGDPAWFMKSGYTRGLLKIPTALGADLASDFPTVVEGMTSENGEPK